jgi:hypothetical protein
MSGLRLVQVIEDGVFSKLPILLQGLVVRRAFRSNKAFDDIQGKITRSIRVIGNSM